MTFNVHQTSIFDINIGTSADIIDVPANQPASRRLLSTADPLFNRDQKIRYYLKWMAEQSTEPKNAGL